MCLFSEEGGEVQMSFILWHAKEISVDEIPLKFLHMNYRMDFNSANMYGYLCLSTLVL